MTDTKYRKPDAAPDYLDGSDGTILFMDYIPTISKEDIDKQSITRYLAKRSNDVSSEIIEIDENQYNILRNVPLYITVKIPWRITGTLDDSPSYVGVITANTRAIENADRIMPGVKNKLVNPLQYY